MSLPPPLPSQPGGVQGSKWYWSGSMGQREEGDFSTLRKCVLSGAVTDSSICWREGMPEWQPIKSVAGLWNALSLKSGQEWWFEEDGQQKGPVDICGIKKKDAKTLVWKQGMENWVSWGTLPEITDAEWFYISQYRTEAGPITVDQLRNLYETFKINDTTMVWKEDMEGWTRLGEVQELSSFAEDMQVKLKESQEKANGADGPSTENKKKKKKKKNNKKRKWVEKKDHSNVYVTGLPKDITVQELYDFMKKAGVIADDSAGSPKIKIYTDDEGLCKGDARITYFKQESVGIAEQFLHESHIRPDCKVTVEKASFTMKGDSFIEKKQIVEASDSVRKALANKASSKLSWDDDGIAVNKKKGLKIVILHHVFDPKEAEGDSNFYHDLKVEVGMEIEKKCGKIEKLTVFEGNPEGVIAVRFVDPASSEPCIKLFDKRFFGGRQIKCEYFDGITNYKVISEEEEKKRLEEFGKWIEQAV